jgi:hypothetical protein
MHRLKIKFQTIYFEANKRIDSFLKSEPLRQIDKGTSLIVVVGVESGFIVEPQHQLFGNTPRKAYFSNILRYGSIANAVVIYVPVTELCVEVSIK